MIKVNPKFLAKNAGKIVQENSPTILAGIAVLGTVATGYFAAKGSFEAAKKIEDERYTRSINRTGVDDSPIVIDNKDRALLIWKLYIPAAGVGALTVASIIASNRIHARRLAALAAGYAVLSGDFDDYREKAAEMLGGKKKADLDRARIKKRADALPASGGVLVPEGKSWFLDMTTDRTLVTTMETIKGAQNEINYQVINHGDASLNDFYSAIGMNPVRIGDLVGWNREHKCELSFTPVLTDERGAVTAFEFVKGPRPQFWKDGPVDPKSLADIGG